METENLVQQGDESSKKRVVAIYSGGMDSFTLLHRLLRQGYEVHALSFNYGQRHSKELQFARRVCAELNRAHK